MLADQSEGGWKTVQEYKSNPVASDSEDEKRIMKAEARATRKIKDDVKKRSQRASSLPYPDVHSRSTPSGQPAAKKPGVLFSMRVAGALEERLLTQPRKPKQTQVKCKFAKF